MRDRHIKTALGAAYVTFNALLFKIFLPEKQYNKMVLTENSGLFSMYELLYRDSLLLHDKKADKILLIKQPYWLDSVHHSRLNTFWGQNYREYPALTRQVIESIISPNEILERMTFAQQRKLRLSLSEMLRKRPDVELIDGPCDDIKLVRTTTKRVGYDTEHLFDFYPYIHSSEFVDDSSMANSRKREPNVEIDNFLQLSINDTVHRYPVSDQVMLYNFSTIPRPNESMQEQATDGSDLLPQTEIYKSAQGQEDKRILLFGSGLSAVWVCEQAPKSEIGIVAFSKEYKLPSTIQRNVNTNMGHTTILYHGDHDFCRASLFSSSVESSKLSGKLYEARKKVVDNYFASNPTERYKKNVVFAFKRDSSKYSFVGVGYNATGFIPNTRIVADLPSSMVVNFHANKSSSQAFFSPKNVPPGALFERNKAQTALLRERNVSDKDKLSFVELDAAVILGEEKQILSEKLCVPLSFVDHVCRCIQTLEDTPDDMPTYLKTVFKEWAERNMATITQEDFEKNVDVFFEERKLFLSNLPKI